MDIYQQAVEIRSLAEQSCLPMEYEHAAAIFKLINFEAAANRCRDRARHYRGFIESCTLSDNKREKENL